MHLVVHRCRLAAENILNILIFGIMGIVIAGKIIDSHGPYALVVKDYGTAVALWALLLVRLRAFACTHLCLLASCCMKGSTQQLLVEACSGHFFPLRKGE